jgi:hypothetical protein
LVQTFTIPVLSGSSLTLSLTISFPLRCLSHGHNKRNCPLQSYTLDSKRNFQGDSGNACESRKICSLIGLEKTRELNYVATDSFNVNPKWLLVHKFVPPLIFLIKVSVSPLPSHVHHNLPFCHCPPQSYSTTNYSLPLFKSI